MGGALNPVPFEVGPKAGEPKFDPLVPVAGLTTPPAGMPLPAIGVKLPAGVKGCAVERNWVPEAGGVVLGMPPSPLTGLPVGVPVAGMFKAFGDSVCGLVAGCGEVTVPCRWV